MKKKLLIDGMSCSHCVNHLKTAFTEDIEGVEVLEVSLEGDFAIVDIQDGISDIAIKEVIEDLGFELKGIE